MSNLFLEEDFQARLSAAQELRDRVASTRQRLIINSFAMVKLYHSTSSANALSIHRSGELRGSTWLSASGKATLAHVKPKFGGDISTLEILVDPRDIEFSTGTGEFYAPTGLKRTGTGHWMPA